MGGLSAGNKFSREWLEMRGVCVGAHSPPARWCLGGQSNSRVVQESELQVPPSTHHHLTTSLRSLVLIAFKHRSVPLSVPLDSSYTCLTATGTEPVPFAQGFYLTLR